jgi:hypothetical protein
MTGLSVDEQYFRWEQDRRSSYYVAETSVPLAHAMAEDYLLEEIAPGKTRFTHTMALEPRFVVELGGPFSKMYFESMLEKGARACRVTSCNNRGINFDMETLRNRRVHPVHSN